MKTVQWELVVPCGRTDMTKILASFRNFAKAPKNTEVLLRICKYSKDLQVHASVFTVRVEES
jgi:hypothetical protein